MPLSLEANWRCVGVYVYVFLSWFYKEYMFIIGKLEYKHKYKEENEAHP